MAETTILNFCKSGTWDGFELAYDMVLNAGVTTINIHALNPSSDEPAFWVTIDDHWKGYAVGNLPLAFYNAAMVFYGNRDKNA